MKKNKIQKKVKKKEKNPTMVTQFQLSQRTPPLSLSFKVVNRVTTRNNYLYPVLPFDQALFSLSFSPSVILHGKQTAKEIALCAPAPSARQSGMNPR